MHATALNSGCQTVAAARPHSAVKPGATRVRWLVGAECRWLAAVPVALLVLLQIPYAIAHLQLSEHLVFVGVWAPRDLAQYGAAMREGAASSSWFIHDHLTGELGAILPPTSLGLKAVYATGEVSILEVVSGHAG